MKLIQYVKRMKLLKEELPTTIFENEQRLLFVVNLHEFLSSDLNYVPSSNALDASLDALSSLLLLHPQYTLTIAKLFLPIIPELVARKLNITTSAEHIDNNNNTNNKSNWNTSEKETIALTLSLLLPIVPQLSTITLNYFKMSKTSIFQRLIDYENEQKSTIEQLLLQLNVNESNNDNNDIQRQEILQGVLKICRATYNLLSFNPALFRSIWNWAPIFVCATRADTLYGWYAARSSTIILRIPQMDRRKYWKKLGYNLNHFSNNNNNNNNNSSSNNNNHNDHPENDNNNQMILDEDVNENEINNYNNNNNNNNGNMQRDMCVK